MNRESTYALSFLLLILISLFFFNLVNPFDRHSLSRFDFFSYITPTNSQKPPLKEACDYYRGQWVWDETYPNQLYDETCPFLDPGFRCRQNGRKDVDYRKWRWQPDGCDLPRYVLHVYLIRLISWSDGPFVCMHGYVYVPVMYSWYVLVDVWIIFTFIEIWELTLKGAKCKSNHWLMVFVIPATMASKWVSMVFGSFWSLLFFRILRSKGIWYEKVIKGSEMDEWGLVYRNTCGPLEVQRSLCIFRHQFTLYLNMLELSSCL